MTLPNDEQWAAAVRRELLEDILPFIPFQDISQGCPVPQITPSKISGYYQDILAFFHHTVIYRDAFKRGIELFKGFIPHII